MRRYKLPGWLADRLGVAILVVILAGGVIFLGQQGLFNPVSGTLLAPLVPFQQFFTSVYDTVYNNLLAPSDLAELPPEVRDTMRFVPVATLEEALRVALPQEPQPS